MWWVILYLACVAFVLHLIAIAPKMNEKGQIVPEGQRPEPIKAPAWAPPLATDP